MEPMKYSIIYCAIVAFLTLSCSDEPRFTRQERVDWINAKSNDINKALALFDKCNIRKINWYKREFLTVVDHDGNSYSGYLDKKHSINDKSLPSFIVWSNVVQFYEFSIGLGIDGVEKSIGTYISFPDKNRLLIIGKATDHDIYSLTRRQPYVRVQEGWFLFLD